MSPQKFDSSTSARTLAIVKEFPHLGQAVLVYRETSLQLARGYSSTLLKRGEFVQRIDARAASKGVATWPALLNEYLEPPGPPKLTLSLSACPQCSHRFADGRLAPAALVYAVPLLLACP